MKFIGLSGGNAYPGDILVGNGAKTSSLIGGDVSVNFGGLGVRYTVQTNLLDVTSSGASYAREDETYTTTLTPTSGLTIDSVIVSMGGTDISSQSVVYLANGTAVVTVQNVSADIVIYASAVSTPDTITLDDVDSSFRTRLTEVVADINNGGVDDISFVIITDPHSANPSTNKSQNIARYLLKNSKANKLFLIGDYCTTDWSNAAFASFASPLLNCAEKVYLTIGNHEYFGGTASGRAMMYGDFLEDKTYLNGSLTDFYWYFDDNAHKVRYIAINTSDGATNRQTATQLSWLATATQLPSSSWKIVLMGHFPLYRTNTESTDEVAEKRFTIRDDLLTSNGTTTAYFCGHTHKDLTDIIDYSFYQQILNCDTNGTAVSVVNINLSTKLVYIYRIGDRGTDISFEYDDLPAMVMRTVTNTLTGCTTDNSTSSLIDGRPYEATLTADVNYDLDIGTVAITMGGVDITSTAYNASTYKISIERVTGNLSISATAEYVAPVVEFTADWFSKSSDRYIIDFPANMGNIDNEFPSYFAVIHTNGTTSFPTGFRQTTYAAYGSRTSGWTQRYWNLIDSTGTDGKVQFTSTTLPEVTVNGKKYIYHTFTRADHDAAYTARQTAIAGGQIAQAGAIKMRSNVGSAGSDIWVLDQNVTAANIESIAKRLPSHLLSITAAFDQGDNVIYTTDTLDSLKQYLTVTKAETYNVQTVLASTDYTLSGTLTAGTPTITVTYQDKTATFTPTVTQAP